jgi:excisionase family DNA binding protein
MTLIGIEMDSIMLSKPFMTTHEIAALLKVSEATVRTWIHEGELRAIRVGREFRVAAKDMEAFVNAHATRSTTSESKNNAT